MKNLCRQQGQGLKACGTTLPKLSLSAPEGGGGGGAPSLKGAQGGVRRGGGGGGGGGRHFLIRGSWGCAAGWGTIFTTALTIIGSHFQ